MYKRMLRSVLATAFVGALAYGVLGATDITWPVGPHAVPSEVATAAGAGDITWGVAPKDITWGSAATPAGA